MRIKKTATKLKKIFKYTNYKKYIKKIEKRVCKKFDYVFAKIHVICLKIQHSNSRDFFMRTEVSDACEVDISEIVSQRKLLSTSFVIGI